MTERTIKLTGDLEAFVDAQIESGAYATPEDVVRAGFEALKGGALDQDDGLSAWERENFVELKKAIDEGIADMEAGRMHRYDNPGDLARDIIGRGRLRSARRKQVAARKKSS